MMLENHGIDTESIEGVRSAGDCATKRNVIPSEPDDLHQRGHADVIGLFGTVDFDPEWDYKTARKRKRL